MLILVGVTVVTAINGGLFSKTKKAARETKNAQIFEQIQLAVASAYKTDTNDFTEEYKRLAEITNDPEEENYYKGRTRILNGEFDNDEADFLEFYAAYMGRTRENVEKMLEEEEISENELLESMINYYREELGISEETPFTKKQLIKVMKDELKSQIGEMFKEKEMAVLSKAKLMEELNKIEGIDRIKETGEDIIEENGEYRISQDWNVIIYYDTKMVTVTGKGEIIGPEEIITKASEDIKAGDITDDNKRTGSQSNPYLITSIEDLVAFSKSVNEGNTYEGKYIELAIDLDFKDSNSYKNSKDTITFGDLNGDGTTKGIQEELTDEDGKGFTPIGIKTKDNEYSFNGNFNGNDHKIKNIYINENTTWTEKRNPPYGDSYIAGEYNSAIALFGNTNNAIIENLRLEEGTIKSSAFKKLGETEEIDATRRDEYKKMADAGFECDYLSGIVSYGEETVIRKCYTKNVNFGKAIAVASIAYNAEKIEECYNTSNISGFYANGIAYSAREVVNCYNTGNITGINMEGEESIAKGIRRL